MRNLLGTVLVFLTGALFSVGLGIGGMLTADKVLGFLSFFSGWDPSLAFVMGGSIAVHLLTWRLATGRAHPLFAAAYLIPKRSDIDVPLVAGAGLFGLGWGLGGYCPGPGIASAATGAPPALVFLGAMIVGMLVHQLLARSSRAEEPVVVRPAGGAALG